VGLGLIRRFRPIKQLLALDDKIDDDAIPIHVQTRGFFLHAVVVGDDTETELTNKGMEEMHGDRVAIPIRMSGHGRRAE
jgi:hypothetical protein